MEHIRSQQRANALASTNQMRDELALATVKNYFLTSERTVLSLSNLSGWRYGPEETSSTR